MVVKGPVLRPGTHRIKTKSKAKSKTKSKRKSPRPVTGKKVLFPTAAKLVKMQGFPRGSPWAVSGAMLI